MASPRIDNRHLGGRVNPGGALITTINGRLRADPGFAQQIRAMHGDNVPLLDMVDQLGLAGEMSAAVRNIVQQLPPADIAAIRQATLAMLDRAENQMPVDCDLSQREIDTGTPVDVEVASDAEGHPVIRVRATTD